MGKSFLVEIQFPPPSKKTVKPIIPSHPIVLNYIWKNWYYKMNSLIMFFLFRCLKHILMSLNISTTIKTRWCTLVRVVSLIHQAVRNKLIFFRITGKWYFTIFTRFCCIFGYLLYIYKRFLVKCKRLLDKYKRAFLQMCSFSSQIWSCSRII